MLYFFLLVQTKQNKKTKLSPYSSSFIGMSSITLECKKWRILSTSLEFQEKNFSNSFSSTCSLYAVLVTSIYKYTNVSMLRDSPFELLSKCNLITICLAFFVVFCPVECFWNSNWIIIIFISEFLKCSNYFVDPIMMIEKFVKEMLATFKWNRKTWWFL